LNTLFCSTRGGLIACGGGRPHQRRINALGEKADKNYDAAFNKDCLDSQMEGIIHDLAHEGPTLCHCVFCGVGHTHLLEKCPILNKKKFVTSFAIRAGSAYLCTLNDAFKRQKEACGIVDTPHDNFAARIHQVFGTIDPAPEPAPAPVRRPGPQPFPCFV
jgi:hypothetical protein